jgi:D-alanine-D-alanine ligase
MANVIVLAGGNSDEREISLCSGKAVTKALQKAGHKVEFLDPSDGLNGLLPKLKTADVVFPALHGQGGEDGSLQKFLEDNDVAFVGSNSQASTLCFDKARYAELLLSKNLPVPHTELVKYQEYLRSELRRKPFVLKPNDGGSSIDTFIVRTPAEADELGIKEAFERHEILLLQELIEGNEITVAILGDEPLPAIEIIPPEGGEFDYENKYNGQTQELCPPKNVSPPLQEQAQGLAFKIHQLAGCRDMSRTDIIVTSSYELYVLETNTIPGLTDESLLPKAAGKAGYSMEELCDKLIQMTLKRHNT